MKTILIPVCLLLLVSCGGNKEESPKAPPSSGPKNNTPIAKLQVTENPYAIVDVSPMDMSYYPDKYPKLKMADSTIAPPLARIIYSRPHLQGRHIFQEVLKYGQPWRLGANESTELELFRAATVQGKKVKAGRYVLYCIPQENEWTIVLNSYLDSWGLKQEPSKDIMKFTIPVSKTGSSIEYYTMVFRGKDNQAELLIAWDNLEAKLPLSF